MNLPPLPEHLPMHKFMSAYTVDQMREYGQQCAQAALEQVRVALDAKAPEPKGLFVDLIAQHEGLADELRDAPEPEPEPDPEPVAWIYHDGERPELIPGELFGTVFASIKKVPGMKNELPLYIHPPAVPVVHLQFKPRPPAAREPLTDEQIEEITADNSLDTIHAVARAIELAHGIGAKP